MLAALTQAGNGWVACYKTTRFLRGMIRKMLREETGGK
jgi:hypothetical protein